MICAVWVVSRGPDGMKCLNTAFLKTQEDELLLEKLVGVSWELAAVSRALQCLELLAPSCPQSPAFVTKSSAFSFQGYFWVSKEEGAIREPCEVAGLIIQPASGRKLLIASLPWGRRR